MSHCVPLYPCLQAHIGLSFSSIVHTPPLWQYGPSSVSQASVRPRLNQIKVLCDNRNCLDFFHRGTRSVELNLLTWHGQYVFSNNLPKICLTKLRILFEASCPSFAGAAKVVAQPEIKKVSNYFICLPSLTIMTMRRV